ncbi:MAG: hypothetical protein M1839_006251 [Geoglossum umbratile]|nr:MAG: hypothetical protein M1839_006251 [Geoglossum umbratile]
MVKRVSFMVHGQVQAFISGTIDNAVMLTKSSKFTHQKATEYGLTGWVRNTEGGKVPPFADPARDRAIRSLQNLWCIAQVEGEAQGDEDSLKKLLADINRGPTYAHVVKLEKSEKDTDGSETSFKIEKTVRK